MPTSNVDFVFRSSHPGVFLGKGVLKICSNFKESTHAEVRFQ